MTRSTRDVFEDHLALRSRGDLETDLARNYAPDVTLLCEMGPLIGHDALRRSARSLALQLPDATFTFDSRQVSGRHAFLVWRARSAAFEVDHGADGFVIEGGLIVAQTIFYRLRRGTLDD